MNKVIVTGGAGFIGSHVVERLIEAGCFVTIIDNFKTGQESNVARFKPGSFSLIRDSVLSIGRHASRVADHRAIFHLAAEVGNINSIEHPATDAETNVLGTITVCEFARQAGMKVIYSSSSAIYGETMVLPVTEEHPTAPLSPYGLSKLTGELYVQIYGRLYGLKYACLRYFNVFGEGQLFNPYSNVIPIFVQRLLNGEDLTVFGDGAQTRDFVHVKDVAEANYLAFRSEAPAGSYNVGTGVRSSLLDLLNVLRELHGPFNPRFEASRAGEVRDSVADIQVIVKNLGFRPTFNLEEGVSAYYRWRSSQKDSAGGSSRDLL